VAKVKKAGAVRVARSGKKAKAKNAPVGASTGRRKAGGRKRAKGKAGKRGKVKVGPQRPAPASTFRVTALDPQKKCGAGTSVQQLFRINEELADGVRAHLVFFDRHGWYCEHGRDCPAVAPAKKFSQKVQKVQKVQQVSVMAHGNSGSNGLTHNGRMRA
jgi:hypothetical protein